MTSWSPRLLTGSTVPPAVVQSWRDCSLRVPTRRCAMSEVANAEMLAAWDGDEGEHWAAHEEHYDATMRAHARLLADAADVGTADQVLDVGCGNGSTTRDAARAAREGGALGIDLSSAMLENARRKAAAEGLANVRFVQGDAQVHEFEPDAFDVVIS